ncbi:D-alanyl-D-alanine carboxypeptidase [Candidatus Microgenomates bacterium]|nr:MAG: D-alanyl-D-alanine carboxypeptidase [Candidatus Microgenomates bacterium]
MKFLMFKTVLFLFFIFLISLGFYYNQTHKNLDIFVQSPLPDFLTITKNNQVSTLNIFLPKPALAQHKTFLKEPIISAKSALIYDLRTNEALFSKNIDERLPMASLTKVMTAIIALENKKDDDKYIVSKNALVGENSMGLSSGERLTLEDLLYGLILPSGNDAAETIAQNFPTGRDAFIKAMNEKSKSLGLINTHFTNPSGLQGDGEQYSTAYDLFVISSFAVKNLPLFNKIASTFRYDIPYSIEHKAFYLENETNLLTSYPGVKGIKTGYTPEAGLCLITYLEYNGHKIIGVILGSNNRREEMRELLDYSLKSQGVTPPNRG